MKKILLQFALLFLVVAALFLVAGRTEGWIEPEEVDTGDITLSGSMYSGKAVTTIILHPDGTAECDANGNKSQGTWEKGSGDIAMIAHVTVKENPVDVEIIDDGSKYTAEFTMVPGMILSGAKSGIVLDEETAAVQENNEEAAASAEESEKKETESAETKPAESAGEEEGYPANTFVLPFTADISEQLQTTFFSESSVWGPALGASGSYAPTESEDLLFSWSNKGQSNKLDFFANGTYEYQFTKMNIVEHGTWSFTDWNIVLTSEGGKEQPAELIKGKEVAENKDEEAGYPANTFVLPFTADISEQLQTTFFSESSVWGPALGASGSYAPTESEDLLFSWSNKGQSNKLDFFANGTYEYQFTKMNIVEHGTWSFADWNIVLISEGGKEQPAELVKGETPAEQTASAEESEKKETESAETKPAESAGEEEGYPANTFVLPFTADISEQLQTTFFSESSVWGPALGASGSYAPTESEDLLFSWSNKGQSNKLDFFANGTYEYQFTKMNIVEHGTWIFDGWKLSVTTEAGRVMEAELTK